MMMKESALMKRIMAVIVVVLMMLLLGAAVASAQDSVTVSPSVPLNEAPPRAYGTRESVAGEKGWLVVNTAVANLRSGDGVQYTVVGRSRGTSLLNVIGRNANSSWWLVQVGDLTGWISNAIVAVRGDLPRAVVYADNVTRIIPVEGAEVLCAVEGGLEYYIVGQSSDRIWFQLDTPCGGGWIRGAALAVRNPASLEIPVTYPPF
jgi:uncharacterized protein YraI